MSFLIYNYTNKQITFTSGNDNQFRFKGHYYTTPLQNMILACFLYVFQDFLLFFNSFLELVDRSFFIFFLFFWHACTSWRSIIISISCLFWFCFWFWAVSWRIAIYVTTWSIKLLFFFFFLCSLFYL